MSFNFREITVQIQFLYTDSVAIHHVSVIRLHSLIAVSYTHLYVYKRQHWDNLAALSAPNPSGRTQTDGTLAITDLDKTEANRGLVKAFLYDVMQGNTPDKTPDYFNGDLYIQHNTGIADGLSGLGAALAALAKQGVQMVYTTVHHVLAQGLSLIHI